MRFVPSPKRGAPRHWRGRASRALVALVCFGLACDSDPTASSPAEDAGPAVDASDERDAASGGSGGADAAASGITASPERRIGTVEPSLATSSQWLGPVRTSGSVTAAVHTDFRDGGPDIYLTRVASDGSVLDPKGLPLGIGSVTAVDIAASAEGFVIVWPVGDPYDSSSWREVRAMFVPSDASVPPGPQVTLEETDTDRVGAPCVGFDGNRFVVVWKRWTPSVDNGSDGGSPPGLKQETHAARLDAGGTLLDAAPLPVPGVSAGSLAGADGEVLLVWPEVDETRASRLSLDHGVVAAAPVVLPVVPVNAEVASGPGVFLFVWRDFQRNVLAARVDSYGEVLDSEPIAVGSDMSLTGADFRVAYVGDAFRVSWGASTPEDGHHTRTATVGVDGNTTPWQMGSPSSGQLAWTWDGTQARAFGTAGAPVGRVFQATDATISEPSPITHITNAQTELGLTSVEDHVLASWTDALDDDRRVMLASLSGAEGATIDWVTHVGTTLVSTDSVSPVSAIGPDHALVAWLDADAANYTVRVKATRVSSSGVVLDTAPLEVGAVEAQGATEGTFSSDSNLAIAAGPQDFLVGYDVQWGNSSNGAQTCATRVDTAGSMEAAGCVTASEPAFAVIGTDYVVAWAQAFRIYVQYLASGDTLGHPIAMLSDSTTYDGASAPSIASDGTSVLAAWKNMGPGPDYPMSVHAASLDRTTLRRSDFRLSDDSAVTGVTVAFDGERYWVVWQNDGDIPAVRAAWLDAYGAVVKEPFTLSEGQLVGKSPAGAAIDAGHFLLGYSAFDAALGSTRGGLRTVAW